MSWSIVLVLAILVMVAAGALHGLSGTGFALIAMPLLATLMGVHEGLQLGFVAALTVCVFALVGMWRDVQWRRVGLLVAGGAVTVPLGYLVVRALPAPILLIIVGVLVLAALVAAGLARPASDAADGRALLLVGAVAGAVHVSSALSAPVFTAYAIRTRWTATAFSATMQPVFIAFNIGSIALWGFPAAHAGELLVLLPAMLGGLALGLLLRRRSSERLILGIATAVSVVAALIAISTGVLGIWPA